MEGRRVVSIAERSPVPQTFLFEYQEDYDLMFRLLVDEAERNQSGTGARISGSVIDRNWRLDNMPRTLDQQQLERLGFDAMAIDFLDGPEAVLCYLADEAGVSKTPIQVNRRPLAAAEIEKMRVLQRWYDRDGSHSIRYSNYGNRYAQQDFRSLQASKILHLTGECECPSREWSPGSSAHTSIPQSTKVKWIRSRRASRKRNRSASD